MGVVHDERVLAGRPADLAVSEHALAALGGGNIGGIGLEGTGGAVAHGVQHVALVLAVDLQLARGALAGIGFRVVHEVLVADVGIAVALGALDRVAAR